MYTPYHIIIIIMNRLSYANNFIIRGQVLVIFLDDVVDDQSYSSDIGTC